MKEIVLYKSPLKSLSGLLISAVFVAISLYFVISGNHTWMWWLVLFLFGISFFLSLINMLDRRPQITINKMGVLDKTTNLGMVPWDMIKEAHEINITNISNQLFISLIMDERFVAEKKVYKWAQKINDMEGGQKVNLYVSKLKADTKKLLTLIDTLKNAPVEEREGIMERYETEFR